MTLKKSVDFDSSEIIITTGGETDPKKISSRMNFYYGKMFQNAADKDFVRVVYMVPRDEPAGYIFIRKCVQNMWEKKSEKVEIRKGDRRLLKVIVVELEASEQLKEWRRRQKNVK